MSIFFPNSFIRVKSSPVGEYIDFEFGLQASACISEFVFHIPTLGSMLCVGSRLLTHPGCMPPRCQLQPPTLLRLYFISCRCFENYQLSSSAAPRWGLPPPNLQRLEIDCARMHLFFLSDIRADSVVCQHKMLHTLLPIQAPSLAHLCPAFPSTLLRSREKNCTPETLINLALSAGFGFCCSPCYLASVDARCGCLCHLGVFSSLDVCPNPHV